MTKKADKKRFIRELISSVQSSILEKVDQMPEEWDGIELRQYVADTFKMQSSLYFKGQLDSAARARRRSYDNEVAIRNL